MYLQCGLWRCRQKLFPKFRKREPIGLHADFYGVSESRNREGKFL